MTTRIYAELGLANEAILRAVSRDDLFQRFCHATVNGSWLIATAVLLVETNNRLHYVAGAGDQGDVFRGLCATAHGDSIGAQDLARAAVQTGRSCIANDYSSDARVGAWRDNGVVARAGAVAAIPIMKGGTSTGVALFFVSEQNFFGDDIVVSLERLVDNLSFVLGRFVQHEETARFNALVAALSATNEVVMRAESRIDLFQLICETVVSGGIFCEASILLPDADNEFLNAVAASGPASKALKHLNIPLNPVHPERRNPSAIAYCTAKLSFSNDVQAECYKDSPLIDIIRKADIKSGAAVPLLNWGKPIGVMIVSSNERNIFSPAFLEVLVRMARNISFAFENFERAEEKERSEKTIRYLAAHDSLTGLANRVTFNELLDAAIKTAHRHDRQCALLFIDLDQFKLINDTFGHAEGDSFLIEMARRLRNVVRASDVIARLGGDEFVILLNDITENHQVEIVANNVLSALAQPLALSGRACQVTASIGIAMFPDDGADVRTLMKHADIAMYQVKSKGRNDIRYFSSRNHA
jgi:diguanylate cyclase (GGDEF)-like protein